MPRKGHARLCRPVRGAIPPLVQPGRPLGRDRTEGVTVLEKRWWCARPCGLHQHGADAGQEQRGLPDRGTPPPVPVFEPKLFLPKPCIAITAANQSPQCVVPLAYHKGFPNNQPTRQRTAVFLQADASRISDILFAHLHTIQPKNQSVRAGGGAPCNLHRPFSPVCYRRPKMQAAIFLHANLQ